MIRSLALFAVGLGLGAAATFAWTNHQSGTPYAGQDSRTISSLSAEDIAALEAGEGWGLAKPAELNGYPGPAHILELADRLDLTPDQKAAVEASFAAMNAQARSIGQDLIDAEAALDATFVDGATTEDLTAALTRTEAARARLRAIHLSAHLEVTPLLTAAQKHRYADLRGYGGGHKGH